MATLRTRNECTRLKGNLHNLRSLFHTRLPRHAVVPHYSSPRKTAMDFWVTPGEDLDAECAALADYAEAEVATEKQQDRELQEEIGRARKILELGDDWDGEGSPAYTEDTLDRAAAFLTTHSEQFRRLYSLHLPVPKISPGPDGSIDIHWKRQSWELLVNIPADAKEMAVFYGDDYGSQKIRGTLDPRTFNLGIASWLMT